jgi:preprotein translocase subunit YajC
MFTELAYAQAGAPGGQAPAFLQFGPLIIIFALAYVLLIRPQRQQERQHRTMLSNLKRNDEVTTTGGIHGRIVSLTDAVVTLEVAPNVRLRVERSQIKGQAKPPGAEDKDRKG